MKRFNILLTILSLFVLSACQPKQPIVSQSTLRISIEEDPLSLDPRRVRDLPTTTIIHMLYEGLMRNERDGQSTLGMAEEVIVSPDQKTYTFKLRPGTWSNGDPVTAYDFEKTWKSTLVPRFPSPNAYQLYVIQGAKAAKEGKGSIDDVGIKALDNATLVVNLAQPTPYFLNLIATHFFYPVHTTLRELPPDASLPDDQVVSNGPFQVEKWSRRNEFIAKRNPLYWDKDKVKLDRIQIMVLDNPTALQLFNRAELDWTGSPLSTLSIEALESLKKHGMLEVAPAAGVYFFRINTGKPPLHRAKMRQALAYALNRKDLVDAVLRGNQQPACGLIPFSFIEGSPLFQDCNITLAKKLWNEALKEQKIASGKFPKLTIHYAANERAHKIAQVAQQQWKENLGLDVNIQSNEAKAFYDRLKHHDYQLAVGGWFADIHDPIAFLDLFKHKNNGTNNTQWEHSQFIALLDRSYQPEEFRRRKEILKEAEAVIINDMPVIPLFFSSYNYVKNPKFHGFFFSELGYIDFKNARWE